MTQLKSALGSQEGTNKKNTKDQDVNQEVLKNLLDNSPKDVALSKVVFLINAMWNGDLTVRDIEPATGMFGGEVDTHYAIIFLLQALQGIYAGCSLKGPISSGMLTFVEASSDPDKFKRELPAVLSHLTKISILGDQSIEENK